jgi:ribosomal protein L9
MAELTVVRLLQNPLGQQAPEGERGDLVRVTDGHSKLYLMPWEFDAADERTLRWMLAHRRSAAA